MLGELTTNMRREKMDKVFVVMDIESVFMAVYSSKEKAQQFVDRMRGTYLGNELIVEETPIDDFSMFEPLTEEQLRKALSKI